MKQSGITINPESAQLFGLPYTKSQAAISLISCFSFSVLNIISPGQIDLSVESDLESFQLMKKLTTHVLEDVITVKKWPEFVILFEIYGSSWCNALFLLGTYIIWFEHDGNCSNTLRKYSTEKSKLMKENRDKGDVSLYNIIRVNNRNQFAQELEDVDIQTRKMYPCLSEASHLDISYGSSFETSTYNDSSEITSPSCPKSLTHVEFAAEKVIGVLKNPAYAFIGLYNLLLNLMKKGFIAYGKYES